MHDALFDMQPAGVEYADRWTALEHTTTAYQRIIREREAEADPRQPYCVISECTVRPVTRVAAQRVISRYEWLGTMRGAVSACYGLISPTGEVLGVAVFGHGTAPASADVCGTEHRADAICLRRGACVHYAPEHAASFLISRATALAHEQHGWSIFYAYADEQAGEIGTVYQACNWYYVGRGLPPPRMWLRPESPYPVDNRNVHSAGLTAAEARRLGWQMLPAPPAKHRYVHFEGTKPERKRLRRALRYEPKPYPKRPPRP